MKFLKLDGVKTISKNAQKHIIGGGLDCSSNGINACMSNCVVTQGNSSHVCYLRCISPCSWY